jgi:hypothetical protein
LQVHAGVDDAGDAHFGGFLFSPGWVWGLAWFWVLRILGGDGLGTVEVGVPFVGGMGEYRGWCFAEVGVRI